MEFMFYAIIYYVLYLDFEGEAYPLRTRPYPEWADLGEYIFWDQCVELMVLPEVGPVF